MYKKAGLVTKIFLAVVMILLLFPILWMVLTSFKNNLSVYKIPPEWIPKNPSIKNYIDLIKDQLFMGYYLNNFIIGGITTVCTVVVSVLGGYSFSRYKFRGSDGILIAFLSTQMMPVVGIIIALYTTYRSLHLLDTRFGLVLALMSSTVPFCMFLMKGFFDDIPRALEEAAFIDGCGRFRALIKVIVPLSSSGIVAIALYTFLISWDDYLYCLTLISSDKLRTLSTGISLRYLGELSYDWSKVMTVSVMSSVPLLIIFVLLQRYMVQGLTAGAVKG
jgi:multiple sugar transport system permease protein